MDLLLASLRAAGEPTRLRLLALCAHAELSVGELVQILGQSQPRISRHLKLLVEAGLLVRFREGVQVFYRVNDHGVQGALSRTLVDLIPQHEGDIARDLTRLEQIRAQRAEAADAYFEANAAQWDKIRQLHVPEEELEDRLRSVVGSDPFGTLLDVGTGTGRMLELFAEQIERGVGIDSSTGMLSVARARLEKLGARHLQVRKGDMYALSVEDDSVDVATMHLVLHYSDSPQRVINEVARTLAVGGRLLIVDFAPHAETSLRDEHRHRWLGFESDTIKDALSVAGLEPGPVESLVGDPLTVNIWQGVRQPAPQRSSVH